MSKLILLRALFSLILAGALGYAPSVALAAGSADATAWPLTIAPAVSAQRDDNATIVPSDVPSTIAQMTPMRMQPPKHIPLWRPGFDYTLDVSIARPFGNTGAPSSYGLPGSGDVILRWGISDSSHLEVGWYGLQEYPVGFDTGIVPVFLQGVATPIATANLATPPVSNVAINNKIIIAHYDQVFWTKLAGKDFPLILSPTFTQRWATIGGGDDLLPVEIDGFPYTLRYRTGSFGALALSFPLPFLTQPRHGLFTTYTIGSQWLMTMQGANVNNHAQLLQILHTVWHPTRQIQIDLAPSLYPNYLATDKWPQHYLTMIYSAAYRFGHDDTDPWGRPLTQRVIPFVQATVSMGGAINISPYGVAALYCQALPCTSPSQLVPQLGGNHAAQVQLKFGVGTPSIIPL